MPSADRRSRRPSSRPQIRNAIDLARMRAAIRVFNEKTSPGSDGMVTEEELATINGCDFPTAAELESAEITGAVA